MGSLCVSAFFIITDKQTNARAEEQEKEYICDQELIKNSQNRDNGQYWIFWSLILVGICP